MVQAMLVAAMLGGCAAPGMARKSEFTYVMVFTVAEGAFTTSNPNCAGNCVPVGFDPEDAIFLVEGLGYRDGERKFTQSLYSPMWHQPDFEKARQWGRCVVAAFDKVDPNFGRVEVTSAYLVRVRAPVAEKMRLQAATAGPSPCELPKRR
jgi:hypothetical protein